MCHSAHLYFPRGHVSIEIIGSKNNGLLMKSSDRNSAGIRYVENRHQEICCLDSSKSTSEKKVAEGLRKMNDTDCYYCFVFCAFAVPI